VAGLWAVELETLTVLLGAFGSGKTEVALNCAIQAARAGRRVALVDLDMTKPAFRSREAAAALAGAGVALVAPCGALAFADLPAIPRRVLRVLANPRGTVVLDAGGSPSGARAVSSLVDRITGRQHTCWVVVNPWRPETRGPEAIRGIIARLGERSRVAPRAVVANLHLPEAGGERETREALIEGYARVRDGAGAADLPVAFSSVRADLLPLALEALPDEVRVLGLELYMRPPWDGER
jgi:hypothetical protein